MKHAGKTNVKNMINCAGAPLPLRNKRIICLDMAAMVAENKYRGEFEERMHKV